VRPTYQRLLYAPVLVSEGDLKVQHLFARALEAKMPRLDYSRMDGPHGDLMNLAAIHPKEFSRRRGGTRAPAHGLKPRMAFGHQAMLLPYLALEHVRLRMG
jgi:hypothetical protein